MVRSVVVFTALFVAIPGVIGAGLGVRMAARQPPVLVARGAPVPLDDIKDRVPAVIPLYDLTDGYLWDLPEPAVVEVLPVVEPVAFSPEWMPEVVVVREPWWPTPWPDEVVGFRGAIPEPATWAMMLAGFAVVGAMMRRKVKA